MDIACEKFSNGKIATQYLQIYKELEINFYIN